MPRTPLLEIKASEKSCIASSISVASESNMHAEIGMFSLEAETYASVSPIFANHFSNLAL